MHISDKRHVVSSACKDSIVILEPIKFYYGCSKTSTASYKKLKSCKDKGGNEHFDSMKDQTTRERKKKQHQKDITSSKSIRFSNITTILRYVQSMRKIKKIFLRGFTMKRRRKKNRNHETIWDVRWQSVHLAGVWKCSGVR